MSEIQMLVNNPIGAVFFVSGAISVLVLLAIFTLKKGNDLHSVLGYLFFFGLSFSNYSAAVSYYEGYLPIAAVSITIPTSSISLAVAMLSIISSSQSLLRLRVHIISSCISATSVFLGTMINWYHFNIVPLDIFKWNDFTYLAVLSVPILIVGGITTFYFLMQSSSHFHLVKENALESKSGHNNLSQESSLNVRTQTIFIGHQTETESETHTENHSVSKTRAQT